MRFFLLVAGIVGIAPAAFADRAAGDYRLGAGDAIRVVVFQNPDLATDTRVSEGGNITFPLLGTVAIGGLTIDAAERRIAQGLRDGGFVRKAHVNIELQQVRGNQVSVLGQVNKPARFPLETFNTRVSDVLAMAGGVAPQGADVVVLSGTRDGKPFRKEIDVPALYGAAASADDMLVEGGDVLFVDRAPMFYIYGEAQRPGAYRVERGMTVQQALATGGGPTPRGTELWLRLHRRDKDGKVIRLSPEWNDPILPNDVLYVRESLF